MKRLTAFLLVFVLAGQLLATNATKYRIRMVGSTYSAKLVGKAATRTTGLTVVGAYNATLNAHEFDIEVTGYYDLYYDAAGGTTWVKDSNWSGSYGKYLTGGDLEAVLDWKDDYFHYDNTTSTIHGADTYQHVTTGADNVGSGYRALHSIADGSRNVGVGSYALNAISTGNDNIGIGYYANSTSSAGSYTVAIGREALKVNTASYNVGVGYRALYSTTTGTPNMAVGFQSMYSNISGTYNIAFGYNSLYTNQTGSYNVAVGSGALYSTVTSYNMAIGFESFYVNSSGAYLTGVGYQAGRFNSSGSYLTLVGYRAGYGNTSGANSVFIGSSAGYANTTASDNVGVGYNALLSNETGINNTAIGSYALKSNTAQKNTAVGNNAGYSNASGEYNLYLGETAGYTSQTGSYNVAAGQGALYLNTASYNIGIGGQAAYNTTGAANFAAGFQSLYTNTSGTYNVALGYKALYTNSTGGSSVAIGPNAGYYETGGSKLFIDNATRSSEADGRQKALVYGVFNAAVASQYLTVNGNLQSQTYNWAVDAQASDTYVIAYTCVPSEYTTGMQITFKANTANTGACTVNVNSLGAKSLKCLYDQDPADNYIKAGSIVTAVYDGTNFQIQSVTGTSYSGGGASQGMTFTNTAAGGWVLFRQKNNSTGQFTMGTGGTGAAGTTFGITSASLAYQHTQSLNIAIGTENANFLAFATTNVERARFEADGDLGIGTTVPIANSVTLGCKTDVTNLWATQEAVPAGTDSSAFLGVTSGNGSMQLNSGAGSIILYMGIQATGYKSAVNQSWVSAGRDTLFIRGAGNAFYVKLTDYGGVH